MNLFAHFKIAVFCNKPKCQNRRVYTTKMQKQNKCCSFSCQSNGFMAQTIEVPFKCSDTSANTLHKFKYQKHCFFLDFGKCFIAIVGKFASLLKAKSKHWNHSLISWLNMTLQPAAGYFSWLQRQYARTVNPSSQIQICDEGYFTVLYFRHNFITCSLCTLEAKMNDLIVYNLWPKKKI